ncbi:MAG: FtsX-like permease family protein [Gemmatimonadota bacterium]|nr:FtsX-like permease family protein [Gemmatimonadota bacterium]
MITLALAAALAATPLPEVLIDRRLAEAASLSTGDTVRVNTVGGAAAALSFVVAGVFERAADPSRIARNEYEVRFHLPDLLAMLPEADRVDRFAVVLEPGAPADSAARWINGIVASGQAFGSEALAEQTSATFRVVSRFHQAIGIVTIGASAIFLLCVMIIRVDERRRDMGVLRLIGVGRGTVFRAIVLEAIGIATLGSALGALLGVAISALVNRYYSGVYDTTLRFALVTPRIVMLAALLGLALGVVAGALAAWRVVGVAPQRLGER